MDLLFLSSDLSLSQETRALAPVLLARLCGEHKYTLVKQKSQAAKLCVCNNLNKGGNGHRRQGPDETPATDQISTGDKNFTWARGAAGY